MQMNDMYLAMLKLILFPADLMAKITLSVKRMPNVQGERNSYGTGKTCIGKLSDNYKSIPLYIYLQLNQSIYL